MQISRAWFDALYQEAFGAVYRQFRRNDELAHDAATDCWIEAVRKPAGYFPSWGRLIGWGLVTARGRALDLLRRERRARMAPLPDGLPGRWCQCAHWSMIREVAVECLADLPSSDRKLLEGHYWEQLSDREIAVALHGDAASSDAPRQAIRRHRKRVEQKLGSRIRARHPAVAEALTDNMT